MTTTHDPRHPLYSDENDTRREIARVIDVCATCRRCTDLCGSFSVMFRTLGSRGEGGLFVPAEQDHIVLACIQCGLCVEACPHRNGPAGVDVPATLRRGRTMLAATGQLGLRRRLRSTLKAFRSRVKV